MDITKELVFIPGPGMGHLVAAVEMGKLLTSRANWLSITFLIIDLPFDTGVKTFTESLATDVSTSSSSRLKFINISSPCPIDPNDAGTNNKPHEAVLVGVFDSFKPLIRQKIVEMSSRITGVIVDMFSTKMIEIASEFDLPSYVFFTSSAAFLGLLFYSQTLDIDKDSDDQLQLQVSTYINPVPVNVLPNTMLDKYGRLPLAQSTARMIRKSKGIIINTFQDLEPHPIQTLTDDNRIPSIYPIGPIINLERKQDDNGITSWLDQQPDSSVVFLCFGTFGSFNKEQVEQIAIALDRSGYRFLWSLRRPQLKGQTGAPDDFTDPDEILPEGFLNGCRNRGKVIGWAPQVAVLSHRSIGGFVTHCGWNSILESLWFGVPMAAWPMYAEQQVNAFELVVELDMGVEIKMEYRNESDTIVTAEEIESAIKRVMVVDSGEENNGLRKKMEDMKEKSRRALLEGGSSYDFLESLIKEFKDYCKV